MSIYLIKRLLLKKAYPCEFFKYVLNVVKPYLIYNKLLEE